ncbi:MAG: glycosyltransferase family 1 protein [Anaerolineales bacterium]|nr:glycosyltransferase family 1 protein [Anaerolineales bacterium]
MTNSITSSQWPRHIAVLYQCARGPAGLSRAFAAGFRENGCSVDLLNRIERWNRPYDMIIGYGPSNFEACLLPAAHQLLSMPIEQRPFFYWWFIESIPNPRYPTSIVRLGAKLRFVISRLTEQSPEMCKRLQSLGLRQLFRRGFRLQIIGELDYFRSKGLLDGLAVTSESRADFLRRLGFCPLVIPIGYQPDLHGRDLKLERDIDVGFLGNINSRRRFLLVEQIKKELAQRNIELSVQTQLYSKERAEFLNRTKIVLNILRAPHDYYGLRFIFCAANKALMISEPVADDDPFIPGQHLVVEPKEKIADSIAYYLAHENLRREIVEKSYRLIREEYTMQQMTGRIIDDSREMYSSIRKDRKPGK